MNRWMEQLLGTINLYYTPPCPWSRGLAIRTSHHSIREGRKLEPVWVQICQKQLAAEGSVGSGGGVTNQPPFCVCWAFIKAPICYC